MNTAQGRTQESHNFCVMQTVTYELTQLTAD